VYEDGGVVGVCVWEGGDCATRKVQSASGVVSESGHNGDLVGGW
jgi:hypothetical protein